MIILTRCIFSTGCYMTNMEKEDSRVLETNGREGNCSLFCLEEFTNFCDKYLF